MMNVFQFADNFMPFVTSELETGNAPELKLVVNSAISAEWLDVVEGVVPSLAKLAKGLANADAPLPELEFFNDDLGDDICAELAWPSRSKPIAILVGDQATFVRKWLDAGWAAITSQEITNKGESWVIGLIAGKDI